MYEIINLLKSLMNNKKKQNKTTSRKLIRQWSVNNTINKTPKLKITKTIEFSNHKRIGK